MVTILGGIQLLLSSNISKFYSQSEYFCKAVNLWLSPKR